MTTEGILSPTQTEEFKKRKPAEPVTHGQRVMDWIEGEAALQRWLDARPPPCVLANCAMAEPTGAFVERAAMGTPCGVVCSSWPRHLAQLLVLFLDGAHIEGKRA